MERPRLRDGVVYFLMKIYENFHTTRYTEILQVVFFFFFKKFKNTDNEFRRGFEKERFCQETHERRV